MNRRGRRGRAGEAVAADHLAAAGCTVLATNYRSRFGEIDLVLQDGDTLVFVEVKTRTNRRYGGGLASVGSRKRRRIITTAQHWLAERGGGDGPIRFDVVAVAAADGGYRVESWIRHAFEVPA